MLCVCVCVYIYIYAYVYIYIYIYYNDNNNHNDILTHAHTYDSQSPMVVPTGNSQEIKCVAFKVDTFVKARSWFTC